MSFLAAESLNDIVGDGPCTVFIADGSSSSEPVGVHVGPGENRGRLGFLPVAEPFSVGGQAMDDSGVLWYQIIVSGLGTGWVSSDDVIVLGNCDEVREVEPPAMNPAGGQSGGSGIIDVYDCTHIGDGMFQWYRGRRDRVTGVESRIGGEAPKTGEWVPGCPGLPEPKKDNDGGGGRGGYTPPST